ncbi:MAG: HAD-IC family P-type ATPase, partial [Bacillota bacterium]|nr:HAD-IC family P-type ATPase [Bacillota bacterium]
MTKKQRNQLIRIIAALILVIVLHFIEMNRLMMFLLYLIPYLIVGGDILKKAAGGILNRQPLDENLLMATATIGAMALAVSRTGDYSEAVAVMLFYQIGEFFQSCAVGHSRRSIGELMDVRPDYANLEGPEGIQKTDPDEVEIGAVILVRPGEKIPIDGVVEEGQASLDTSALTGESVPRSAGPGDEVLSGCINLNGVLRIRTTCAFDESTASRILDLMENASSRKARSERFISRFARIYTPVVVFSALALALVPPLIQMGISGQADWGEWVYRALTFLVISCPCALVISVPLSFFSGIGGASRQGILIKGANFLETLAGVRTVVMDKTGTLTQGVFAVTKVELASGTDEAPEGDAMTEERLLALAAAAERHSSHPIALALKAAAGKTGCGAGEAAGPREKEGRTAAVSTAGIEPVSDVQEIAGHGIRARAGGHIVCVGNRKLMAA